MTEEVPPQGSPQTPLDTAGVKLPSGTAEFLEKYGHLSRAMPNLAMASKLGSTLEELRRNSPAARGVLGENFNNQPRPSLNTFHPEVLKGLRNPTLDLMKEQRENLILILEALQTSAKLQSEESAKAELRDKRDQKQWRLLFWVSLATLAVTSLGVWVSMR